MGKRATLAVLVILLGLPLVALAQTITTIDVPGGQNTAPQGINARGDIVGVFIDPATGATQGFLLSQGTFTTI